MSGIVAAGLWAVHDREDAAGAQEFVDGVSKTAYPENASQIEIDGATAYFGTNGQRYATVVYIERPLRVRSHPDRSGYAAR